MNRVVEDFLLKVERHVIMGLPNYWEWFYDEKNDISTLEDKDGTIIAKMVGQHLTIAGSESLASFVVAKGTSMRKVDRFVLKWLSKLEHHPHKGWSWRFDMYDLQTVA